jgi:hypothetical protein
MVCRLCQTRGKTWDGDDPKCAFENQQFIDTNWNCATLNKLRNIAENTSSCFCTRDDDESIGVIPFDGEFLVMTWYKNRGRVDNAVIMNSGTIYPLDIQIAEKILSFYK